MFRIQTLAACLVLCTAAQAQTVRSLKHQPPGGAGIGFLLTDGRVLYQGNNSASWYTLTPDSTGQYVDGTWKQVGSLPSGYSPDAFASSVLADGRVVIAGGEYNFNNFELTDLCAIFDPVANTWSSLSPPSGWGYIGDSPSAVLPNGKFLLGRKLDKRIAELDPATLTWTELASTGKKDFNAEEGWTLMPDGTVLTYDVKKAPHAERYDETSQAWASLGSTVANLASPPAEKEVRYPGGIYHPPGEVGPGILRPDGTVFATGGTNPGATSGHTAIYTPGANGKPGSWKAGPDFPAGDDAGDSFAALLPTGDVLVEGESGRLYEFDGSKLTQTPFSAGGNSLLVLPTGEVLVGGIELYRAAGNVPASYAPVITSFPASISPGSTYQISGQQFNGLSQANAFGDEFETATNYPLVLITNTASGTAFYAKTHDHSTMGVATGAATVSTNFDVPSKAPTGPGTLVVIANGIASQPVNVTIQ
jgi:hypothetical protein